MYGNIKKILFLGLVILLFFVLVSCNDKSSEYNMNNDKNSSTEVVSENNEKEQVVITDHTQDVKNFMKRYYTSIESSNAEEFKNLIDDNGIYAITYFIDGRDQNKVVHLYRDDIGEEFPLLVNDKKKVGIDLYVNIDSISEINDMPVTESDYLSSIIFDINWYENNEKAVEERLQDIIDTCEKIILTNNEYMPQIFGLKNNIYAYSLSSIYTGEHLGIEIKEFLGHWVIFENINGKYVLRAVMEFQ